MRPSSLIGLTGLLAAVLAGAAAAQPAGPAPVAVLYDQPNFHGRWVRVAGGEVDLRRLTFAGAAMSGQFEGDWMVCDGPRYAGRCVTVTGAVADLTPLGLDHQIASLRQGDTVGAGVRGGGETAGEPQADDGYYDRGRVRAQLPPPSPADASPPVDAAWRAGASGDPGVAGYGSVFFIRPRRDGEDIPGAGRDLADRFCRDQGLGPALYFDSDGHILRDVLCRRG